MDARNQDNSLRVGDFAHFRAADADQHDPEGLIWHVGIVSEVIPDEPGRPCPVDTYVVYCTDGIVRHFMDYERFFPNEAWDHEAVAHD